MLHTYTPREQHNSQNHVGLQCFTRFSGKTQYTATFEQTYLGIKPQDEYTVAYTVKRSFFFGLFTATIAQSVHNVDFDSLDRGGMLEPDTMKKKVQELRGIYEWYCGHIVQQCGLIDDTVPVTQKELELVGAPQMENGVAVSA